MRHGKSGKTLGMGTAHRVAVLRNMAISLIEHGRIETTLTRAKALRVFIEPLITAGKRDDLSSRRHVLSIIPHKDTVKRLFGEVSPVFKERPGGYTRIMRTGRRQGDNASMAIIEFVDEVKKAEEAK
ncbi:MAG: 50S ribosomal protein L17 [Deferribacteraceae bacterium]|jgi:large subunit ribosomal protein L17|nr:50S ribosomal protein L17 [Deferribacteraceae bacterium]